jgi:hypothetical protein
MDAELTNRIEELDRAGLSVETLSEAWGIDAEDILKYGKPHRIEEIDRDKWSDKKLMREITVPLGQICHGARTHSDDPAHCVRAQIAALTDPDLRRVSAPQMTFDSISRFSGVSVECLDKFYGSVDGARTGEDCLTEAEITKLAIGLLIIDRELNYKARRDYFWMMSEN